MKWPQRLGLNLLLVLFPVAVAALITMAFLSTASAEPKTPPTPAIEELGDQRYRIGQIVVDKAQQKFTVPAVVLRLDPPLEYMAVTKGGPKGYESLLEMDADAYEFNLACILIGLDADKAEHSRYHFDKEKVEGDPVTIAVNWEKEEKKFEVMAHELLLLDGKTIELDDWRYTGSTFAPGNRYLAQEDGVLVGFIHDPASVIEHGEGLGLGDYGAVGANSRLNLIVGTPVEVTVSKRVRR